MTDITSGLSSVFNLIFSGFKWCFDTLDSISFMGISLLDYLICLIILGIAIPLVVTIIPSRGIDTYREIRVGDRVHSGARQLNKKVDKASDEFDNMWNDMRD